VHIESNKYILSDSFISQLAAAPMHYVYDKVSCKCYSYLIVTVGSTRVARLTGM
jgi:hypothetical protein